MKLKKTIPLLVLVALSVLGAVSIGWLGRESAYFLGRLFHTHITSLFLFQFLYLILIVAICAVIAYRFALKKWIVILLALAFSGAFILRVRYVFYVNHDHRGDMGPMVLDCSWEQNYDSFWDYLTKSCHMSVSDLVRMVVERTVVLTVTFLLVYWLMKRRSKRVSKKTDSTLIDK